MGGFVKVSIREENEITTRILDTNELNEFLGNAENLFINNIKNEIKNKKVPEKYLFDEDFNNKELLSPFNYGYIFIDRIKKVLFYINNYTSLSHYLPIDFTEETYESAKVSNYICTLSNFDGSKVEKLDIRKKYLKLSGFGNYYKLYNSINHAESITFHKLKETILIKDISFEEIIEKAINNRKKEDLYSANIEFSINWKNWTVYDRSSDEDSYKKLYEYLLKENLLSEIDKKEWRKEIEYIKD